MFAAMGRAQADELPRYVIGGFEKVVGRITFKLGTAAFQEDIRSISNAQRIGTYVDTNSAFNFPDAGFSQPTRNLSIVTSY
jgi:hypothetical protein